MDRDRGAASTAHRQEASVTQDRTRRAIDRSGELHAVTQRFWRAFAHGDADAAIGRTSTMDGVTFLGTAENEFLDDADRIRAVIRLNFDLLGEFPISDAEIDARAEGSVGWAVVRGSLASPEGPREMRATLVFHLEQDEWRIVHHHYSVAVPNPETFGMEIAIDRIAEQVEAERPDLGSLAATDGTVTIVFTDIVGSTELTTTLGDQAWLDVLRAHNEIVTGATAAAEGMVVKGQGDGFMLAFRSARRALTAARAIQRGIGTTFDDPGSPIRIRVGVHTGEILREADDFFGQAVNYAARVAAAAGGDEIVVSSLVRDLVGSAEFAFGEPREVEFKGFAGLHRVYPLEPA
jgi:class 3 adenylate cyclase/ketosteroid isomerase-like protein